MLKSFSFAICFLAVMVFSADVTAPKGSVRNLGVDDFMPHPNSAKEYNETWSYQFVFDNGTRAYVNFATLYVPGSGPKTTCDMSFWNFKGKNYTIGRQYPPERLKPMKAEGTINIKNEYLMEHKPGKGHRVLFTADKNGKWFMDLTFDSAEQGKVIGDGIWKVGNEKFAQYIHIPYGRVSGRIGYNEDTLTVKGFAYMDQIWQTVQATDIAARTISFSGNSRTPLFGGRLSLTKEGKPLGYAIYNDANSQVATPKTINDGGAAYNGKNFPKGDMEIQWNEANVPAFKFSVAKPFHKASILDKVDGWFAKKAFKIGAGGEIMFYRGRSDGSTGKKVDWVITGFKD